MTKIKGVGTPVGEDGPVKTAFETLAPVERMTAVQATRGFASKRLAREWKTIEAMIRVYCRGRHCDSDLCAECRQLLDYASLRLERCRFGAEKPTCARCPVHCYQRDRREQIKVVMRYAGPRMVWRHPILSLRHWLDGFRRASANEPAS